ncbi:MAG: tetratricopeptide repeat protein [Alphaproteobacteria bacterium]
MKYQHLYGLFDNFPHRRKQLKDKDQKWLHEQFMKTLQEKISSEPEQAAEFQSEILIMEGETAAAEGHLEHALGYFNEAAAVFGQNVSAIVRVASVMLELDKPNVAQSLYEIALKKDPFDPGIATGLGVCQMELGQIPQARNTFKKVADERETYAPAHFFLAVLESDRHEMKRYFNKAMFYAGVSGSDPFLQPDTDAVMARNNPEFRMRLLSGPDY